MLDRTAWLGPFTDRPPLHKIAILGFTSHMKQFPVHDLEWEVWGINDLYHELGAVFNRKEQDQYARTRWFQLHAWDELHDHRPAEGGEILNPLQGPPHPRDPNHLIWLKEASEYFPVYLQEPREEMPNCLTLPKQAIYDFFRDGLGKPVKYFTNTISWQVAFAILNLVDQYTLPDGRQIYYAKPDATLGMWGVDMMQAGPTQDAEYSYQRPSVEWLLGEAMGLGIKVIIPDESDMLKTIYQYGELNGYYARKRIMAYLNDVNQQGVAAQQQITAARDHTLRLEGAKGAMEWVLRSHMPGDDGSSGGQLPEPGGNRVTS